MLAGWIARRGVTPVPSLAEIAWIHLVALGWVSVAALSILLHALPNFIDVERWRCEPLARVALAVAAAAIAALVGAFLFAPHALAGVAAVLALALAAYLLTAWWTLAPALHAPDRIARAVARAFAVLFGVFAIVVVLGVLLAAMLSGSAVPFWVARLPSAHATLALFGWLTLLVYGVSARTLRPITGVRAQRPWMHAVYGSATLLGAPVLALGAALIVPAVEWIGGALLAAGALGYALDVGESLRRATVPHRPPQAFVAAGVVWLLVALVLGAGILRGAAWQSAFGFVLLMGWIGAMVNAHMLHIGVRLIATIYRGDEDETRPQDLLDARASWSAFVCAQAAVLVLALGLLGAGEAFRLAGAILGFLGWIAMIVALAGAARSARRSAGI